MAMTGYQGTDPRVGVVIATRDRPASLARTLSQLAELRPPPPVVVVDNASTIDHSWLHDHPARPRVIRLERNLAAAARTVGARHLSTRYVAFSDDDSWWAPGALPTAADALDNHPRLALVAARTLVGPRERPDPVNQAMAGSPLPKAGGAPGTPVLGCLACATVVRRDAFLDAGGFRELISIGGEEMLLCYDLAAAGWQLRYLADVVAHHHPAPDRPPQAHAHRHALERRNRALIAWMRRPLPIAAAESLRLVRASAGDPAARAALAGLIRRLPAALAGRRRLPVALERDVRLLERTGGGPH